jgi:hypothetical protein
VSEQVRGGKCHLLFGGATARIPECVSNGHTERVNQGTLSVEWICIHLVHSNWTKVDWAWPRFR